MKKILFAIGLSGCLLAGVENANAADIAGSRTEKTFEVAITLIPACSLTVTDIVFADYVAGQAGSGIASSGGVVGGNCTGGMTITTAFDSGIVSQKHTDSATGLEYKLELPSSFTYSGPDGVSFSILASIASGQWGKCAPIKTPGSASCTNAGPTNLADRTRTLIFTY